METDSEFGKGLTYCIGLFLAHAERETKGFTEDLRYEMWFNGASDHLYELDTTSITNDSLKKEIDSWREKVLRWGHGFKKPKATKKDMTWAINKATELLRKIDETMLNIKTINGSWE